jgi:hypothetical protein
MIRQAILERLGWSFLRVRASEFYRAPERAMEALLARLGELRIKPAARGAGDEPMAAASAGHELRTRVLARAEELRRKWAEQSQRRLARAAAAAAEPAERPARAAGAKPSKAAEKAKPSQPAKGAKPTKPAKAVKPVKAAKPTSSKKPSKKR